MYPLGRILCRWPTGELGVSTRCTSRLLNWGSQAHPHHFFHHKKAIEFVYCFHAFARGPKEAEPEGDPWNFSVIVHHQLSLSTSRWRCFITPMWWYLLWSFSWVWAWSKGCCSFSSQTPETNQSLFVLSCLCTDAAVSLLLQICNHSKLQLCGKYIKIWTSAPLYIFWYILFWEEICCFYTLHKYNIEQYLFWIHLQSHFWLYNLHSPWFSGNLIKRVSCLSSISPFKLLYRINL